MVTSPKENIDDILIHDFQQTQVLDKNHGSITLRNRDDSSLSQKKNYDLTEDNHIMIPVMSVGTDNYHHEFFDPQPLSVQNQRYETKKN